jgi:hypothetical protein
MRDVARGRSVNIAQRQSELDAVIGEHRVDLMGTAVI